MLRSMYSGISGLKGFQTKLDVIGNNIANVNTYGFKKSRVVFSDLISQTTAGASASTATKGGTNPVQVGLGTQVSAIDTITGTGSLQTTSRTLDLAISGDGYFMVGNGIDAAGETEVTNVSFTRAGNFYMDAEGYLVDSEGNYLAGINPAETRITVGTNAPTDYNGNAYNPPNPAPQGFTGSTVFTDAMGNVMSTIDYVTTKIQIPTSAQSMSIGQDGVVNYVDADGNLQTAGKILMSKFPNAGGLEKVGSNYYKPTANSGDPLLASATESGIGSIQSGFLEMSNVDLSEEFTEMIVAQRGFQANSRIITTSDEILQELVNLKR